MFFGSAPAPLPTQRGLSRKHIMEACDQAIERLQVDYLDLYFCHRPDPDTPIEETVRAMDVLVRQGKVFYWGTSEWSAQQITEAHSVARQYSLTPPTMEQPQYNLFHRARVEMEYAPVYENFGLGTTIWSPPTWASPCRVWRSPGASRTRVSAPSSWGRRSGPSLRRP